MFEEIFEYKVDVTEYDIFDQRTGKKTGKKGTDKTEYYVETATGVKVDIDPEYEDGLIRHLDDRGGKVLVGVVAARVGMYDDEWYKEISTEDLAKSKNELTSEFKKAGLTMPPGEPKLILKLNYS